jgi:cytochrome d ubiquinol oxidase subunit II
MGAGKREQRDRLISSIGPFWDANETWLVLAIGILLIAFPLAYGKLLYQLYMPVALMLASLIVRGVAFDFRTKATHDIHHLWDWAFKLGSLGAALCQGYMLGRFVTAFGDGNWQYAFCLASAVGVAAAYCLVGAAWLVMKTDGALQKTSARQGQLAARICAVGILLVCIATPLANESLPQRWFAFPVSLLIFPLPLFCFALLWLVDRFYEHVPLRNDAYCFLPYLLTVFIFWFCYQGFLVSFYPYVMPWQLTIWESASATESLWVIFLGAVFVVPVILLYTIYSHRVFRGKAAIIEREDGS